MDFGCMPSFYIVSTPIGNLEDITLRALRILKEADFILCEDTRVTKRLLSHFGISAPTMSFHQHSKEKKYQEIAELLKSEKNLALVTDSGTPGISDPGNELVSYALAHVPGVSLVPVPGPSALTAAASVAGIPMDKFLFLGFPPHKKGRTAFFEKVSQSEYPIVFYESPFRIGKSLRELAKLNMDAQVVVCRELTKKFETVYRGNIMDMIGMIANTPQKGEFVVIVQN